MGLRNMETSVAPACGPTKRARWSPWVQRGGRPSGEVDLVCFSISARAVSSSFLPSKPRFVHVLHPLHLQHARAAAEFLRGLGADGEMVLPRSAADLRPATSAALLHQPARVAMPELASMIFFRSGGEAFIAWPCSWS